LRHEDPLLGNDHELVCNSLLLRNGPESKHASATTREHISNGRDETYLIRAERFKKGQAGGKRQKSAEKSVSAMK
jgi:hypothetical protein